MSTIPPSPAARTGEADAPRRAVWATRTLALIGVVAAVFGLKASRPVTMPLVAAVFVVVLAWPLYEWLGRRLHRALAYTGTVLAILIALAAFGTALGWSARSVAEKAPEYRPRVQQLRAQVEGWAQARGIPLPQSGGSTAAEQGLSAAKGVASAVYGALGLVTLVLAFALLGLAEARELLLRVRRRFDRPHAAALLDAGDQIATAFRRYFAVKTLTSGITGVATGLLALAFGLDFAFIWGLAAFLLEYVPTIGSIIAVIPPSAFAFLQFDGLAKPLGALAAFAVLQVTLGNIIDPRIEGRYMSLSPVMVLLSIVFWAWLWGPVGALLGVPLTVAVVVICERSPRTRWLPALVTELRDDERPDPAAGGTRDADAGEARARDSEGVRS